MVDDIPNSEMVPSSHAKCSSILRVAHHFRRTYPRIAYLCVYGALEESKRINPLLLDRGVPQFRFSLMCWIQKNDETGEQGQILPNTDVPYLQSFCQDYYEKTIVALITAIGIKYLKAIDSTSSASTPLPNDNQASAIVNVRAVSDQLIHACKTACVLFKVLELLSKEAQLPPEILEAHTEIKQLVKIFRPYNFIPYFDYNENHPIRRIPELRAAINALNYQPWSVASNKNKRDEDIDSGLLKRVNNPCPAQALERPACEDFETAGLEIKTADKPYGVQVSSLRISELLLFIFSASFLFFLVIFVIFIIKLADELNNQNVRCYLTM